MPVPNTFANATATIPLSQLDANFATTITLGNTAIQLGNTVSTLNNMTLANVTVTSGNVTITNVTVTTANVTTANIATAQIANVTVSGTGTFAAGSNTAPSITFTGDTNTGIYSPAADTIAFTEGGVESMRITSAGDVGIGTSTPATISNRTVLSINNASNGGALNLLVNGTETLRLLTDNSSFGYVYNIANQPLVFGTNNTERMRLDSSGNLGLGVTPSAWGASWKSISFNTVGAVAATTGVTRLYHNAFNNDSNNIYRTTAAASMYSQSGDHAWYTAPSGTAGNPITFTQAMTLTNDPCLVLARPFASNTSQLQVLNTAVAQKAAAYDVGLFQSDDAPNVRITEVNSSTSAVIGEMTLCGGDGNVQVIGVTGSLVFATNRAAGTQGYQTTNERARITSDGAFCINTNAGTSGSSLAITGSGSTGATYNVYTRNSASNVVFATENGGVIYTGTLGGSPYNNTTASAANMFVTSGGVLQRSTSSGRFKTEVEDLEVGRADAILNLRPVWYRSTCQSDNPNWSWYGLIAEDVAQVEPRLVHWGYDSDDLETVEVEIEVEKERTVKDDDDNETVEAYTETVLKPIQQPKEGAQLRPDGVQYDRMTVLLLDIVKRQQSRLEALEAEIAALKGNA